MKRLAVWMAKNNAAAKMDPALSLSEQDWAFQFEVNVQGLCAASWRPNADDGAGRRWVNCQHRFQRWQGRLSQYGGLQCQQSRCD
ncbi:MAG: hypothetical protein U0401_12060 [Anaerolineae bacterium]